MQNDKYTDFDLELKRMLQDAEEEVPSRIWHAVSDELDRRDRRKVVALRWRRAAVGFAAAAAVLSGIFVFLGRDRAAEPDLTAAAVKEQAASPDMTAEEAVPTIEEQIVSTGTALADVPARSPRSTVSGTVPSEVVPADTFTPAEEETEEAIVGTPSEVTIETEAVSNENEVVATPDSASPVQDPASHPAETDTRTAITGTPNDPFAWPEDTDAEEIGHLPSLVVAGNAMTNDFSGQDIRQMRAPASGIKTRTGVEDKGSSTFSIPITFGLGVRFDLSDRWAVGTGINWSRLSRTFNGVYTEVNDNGDVVRNINSEIVNDIHYIGIPLNLYFNIFDSRNLRFYAWGGGSAEKGLVSRFRIQSNAGDISYKESVNGLQWSAAAGLGLEFLLGEHLGLYLDPSARYYFDCGQPLSIRTERPFMMNYEVGLRFNL